MIREAVPGDATAMSEMLQELIAAGQRASRGDVTFVRLHYIEHPYRLHCLLAEDEDGTILGFQSLKCAHDGNPYDTPTGWGIIGTHIRPSAARRGVGSQLFAETLSAAGTSQLPAIEAYISDENEPALGYYESLGFRTRRSSDGIVRKVYELKPP